MRTIQQSKEKNES